MIFSQKPLVGYNPVLIHEIIVGSGKETDVTEIIFLGTDTHKEGIFGNYKWLEILYDYFPESIAKYKDHTIKEVHPDVNAKERQQLRDKGYTLGLTKIKDTVYFSPGIGRSTSGHAMAVTRTADAIFDWTLTLKKQLLKHEIEICEYLEIEPEQALFNVFFRNENLEPTEQASGKTLLQFPNIFIETEV